MERATSFRAGADAYDRGRPDYPPAALRACLPPGATRALDVGAGTGKLARGLLSLGVEVVAVEPLAEMRAHLPDSVEAIAGAAENLPLPDASVDAVLVGQAFHWFDRPRALREMARVLRPGGRLGIIWNLVDDSVPWVARVAAAYGGEDRWSVAAGAPRPFAGDPDLSDPDRLRFPHAQLVDADRLADSVASRSRVILMEPAERAALLDKVRALAPPGRFELPLVCDVWGAERLPG